MTTTALLGNIAPTTADLEVHGPDTMLTALRAEFSAENADQPEWAGGAVLAIARQPITDVDGQVLAEPGDLILARRDPCRSIVATLPPQDVAWLPRSFVLARLIHGDADDVSTGAT